MAKYLMDCPNCTGKITSVKAVTPTESNRAVMVNPKDLNLVAGIDLGGNPPNGNPSVPSTGRTV